MKYRVHTVHQRLIPVPAKLEDGTEVVAQVRGVEVELVSEDPAAKTLTHVVQTRTSETEAAALDLFQQDRVLEVEITFTPVEA